jgi:CheY-like chemotaxis protein
VSSVEDRALHVLVVDDDGGRRLFTRAALEGAGHIVEEASSAEEARDLLGQPPDLILLDLILPGIDGFEFTRQLKADPRTTRIPVLMITGQAMPLYERLAHAAGCDGFMVKGGSTAVLRAEARGGRDGAGDPLAEAGRDAPGTSPRPSAARPDWLDPV